MSLQGLYWSPFVIESFSRHLKAINGAIWVEDLYCGNLDDMPCGAIGLSGAAVRRTPYNNRLSDLLLLGSSFCIPLGW